MKEDGGKKEPSKRRWPRWYVVIPLGLALFFSGASGYETTLRTQAYLAYNHGDFDRALQLYSQIGDNSGCGMTLLALHRIDEAMTYFIAGNDYSGQGLCHLRVRDYTKALQSFAVTRDNRGLGLTYLWMRDEENAIRCFSDANDWSGLGLVYLAKKDYKQARECFNQVKDHGGLGLVSLEEKKFAEAREHFTKIDDQGGLGLVCLAERDCEGARACFQKINDYSGLGKVCLIQRNYKLAEYYFSKGFDYQGLGDLYSHLHQFEKARQAFARDFNAHKVLQSYRNDFTLADRYPKAIAYGSDAIKHGNMKGECLLELGDIYYDAGYPQQAAALLEQAKIEKGYESDAHLHKGRIHFYQRQLAKARAELEQVKSNDLMDEHRVRNAEESLQAVQRYEKLKVQPAASY